MSETITLPGSGLVFVNTYDNTVSAAYRSAIIAAENVFQSHFTNSVTINESFSTASGNFVAENSAFYLAETFSALRSALTSHATTADDSAAASVLNALNAS